MRVLILIFVFLIAPTAANSQTANEKPVKFLSYPEEVLVTITDKKDENYIRSCLTPCKLRVDRQRSLIFLGTKSGYKNSHESGAYASNDLNLALSMFDDPSFAQATPSMRLTLVPLIQEPTPEKGEKPVSQVEECVNYLTPEGFSRPRPIKTKAPKMPRNAKGSGHCMVRYNIDQSGNVVDVKAISCTDYVFQKNSIKAIKQWKYKPSDNQNSSKFYCDIETKVSYRQTTR